MKRSLYFSIFFAVPLAVACNDDTTTRTDFAGETTADEGISTAEGNESNDGKSSGGDGDGDGDADASGDGDGDSSGDGDGDSSGDGDGDSSGDGDGDNSGEGDGDDDPPTFCTPGTKICSGEDAFQTCIDDGSEYGPPVSCGPAEACSFGSCLPLCQIVESNPSSVGCSFTFTKHDNYYSNVNDSDQNDSVIAGNVSSDHPVTAQLYYVPVNSNVEQAHGEPIMIPPQGTYTWSLSQAEIDSFTTTRQGGVYRLETDRPIVAYQHSPIGATATNDASMLLPDHALTGNYVVSSYPSTIGAYPSYLMAISITDGSVVDITVGGATAAGGGVPALAAGQSTQLVLDRFELLNLVVAQANGGDLSGTIISSDSPLHIVGATECANVPNGSQTFCDHVEEVMFPLEYWGEEYVGAKAPPRGSEKFHWRVYGGADGVTINTAPPQPGFPLVLDKGEYYQFQSTQDFVFTGDGPFLPVQYLESQNPSAGTGDPAMYQMVPTEQFLDSYAFVTGTNYSVHYAQIIRPAGGADVFVDGNLVGNYSAVGNYEVANVQVTEGAHFATSDQPFGIIQVGYTAVTSYAYPGGLKLEVINPQ